MPFAFVQQEKAVKTSKSLWHLEPLTWRNFTHGRWMPAIPLVAVWTLDKDGAITQALGKYLPSDVVEPNSSSCKQQNRCVCMVGSEPDKGRKESTALWPVHDPPPQKNKYWYYMPLMHITSSDKLLRRLRGCLWMKNDAAVSHLCASGSSPRWRSCWH